MAGVKTLSAPSVLSPALDFSAIRPRDRAFKLEDYQEITADPGYANGQMISFRIGRQSKYQFFPKAYINLQMAIWKNAQGTAWELTDSPIAMENNAPVFTTGNMRIGSNTIQNIGDMARTSLIWRFINMSHDMASWGSGDELFYVDSGSGKADIVAYNVSGTVVSSVDITAGTAIQLLSITGGGATAGAPALGVNLIGAGTGMSLTSNPNFNPGFIARRQRTAVVNADGVITGYSATFSFNIPVDVLFPILGEVPMILPPDSPEVELNFQVAPPPIYLQSNANPPTTNAPANITPVVQWVGARLFLPSFEPTNEQLEFFLTQTAGHVIFRNPCYAHDTKQIATTTGGNALPALSTNISVPNGSRISKLCLFFASPSNQVNYVNSPNLFYNCNITNVQLSINGSNYPNIAYRPAFAPGAGGAVRDVERVYRAYSDVCKRSTTQGTQGLGAPVISRQDFEYLHPMFWYSLDSRSEDTYTGNTTVAFAVNGTAPAGIDVSAYLYYEVENELRFEFRNSVLENVSVLI